MSTPKLKSTSVPSASDDFTADEDIDFVDTFLDAEHLVSSFPNAKAILFKDSSKASPDAWINAKTLPSTALNTQMPPPPYRLQISHSLQPSTASNATSLQDASGDVIRVISYSHPNPGPYPEDRPPRNAVRFTPVQVEAIRSGLNPGLTMLVGPPGTGKTDTAVQVIANLYHNFPTQKILLVTHSNAALNDLFEKIMERDVDPRHFLRLGSGERDLRETLALAGAGGGGRGQGEEFSKQGRVNWSLARRIQLLSQVQKLAISLGVSGDVGYTCETAEYFYLSHVQARIEKFSLDLASGQPSSTNTDPFAVSRHFPFSAYFADTPKPLFCGSYESDLEAAHGCFRHIGKLFEELADYKAFELLRSQAHRGDYLLTKQVKLIFCFVLCVCERENNLD